jgi:hypothetical protein
MKSLKDLEPLQKKEKIMLIYFKKILIKLLNLMNKLRMKSKRDRKRQCYLTERSNNISKNTTHMIMKKNLNLIGNKLMSDISHLI